jgi:carbamate kinase
MRVVIALGGNALLRRGDPPDLHVQRRNIEVAAEAVAQIAREHTVILTHGNGPQIGFLAMQTGAQPTSLDALGAESEGLIGYMIEQAIANRLPGRAVGTLLTQVEVDCNDPAFGKPEKPIGPVLDEAAAQRLSAERGWTMARADGGFRRVVPSPEPRRIIELAAIQALVTAGVVVICAGGGGIPVTIDAAGAMRGVEAVIDKDLSAALLAAEVHADRLLLLTDVPGVFADWPECQQLIHAADAENIAPYDFAAGSMRPKLEAARRFVQQTGGRAAIGALDDAVNLLAGVSGTMISAGGNRMVTAGGRRAVR